MSDIYTVGFEPQKFSMTFNSLGRLYEGDDGILRFDGDVDESATIFFNYLCKSTNSQAAKMTNDVELLREAAKGMIYAIENHYVDDPEFSSAYNKLAATESKL